MYLKLSLDRLEQIAQDNSSNVYRLRNAIEDWMLEAKSATVRKLFTACELAHIVRNSIEEEYERIAREGEIDTSTWGTRV